MENCSLVSIILPVHNIARYLAICLDSVLAQSYADWELIAVDDASEDNSLVILREYAQRDQRISVKVLPKNQGVSLARNLGIAEASGRWLMFIDGDDLLHKDTLARSVALGEKTQAEIVMWNIHHFFDEQEARVLRYKDDENSPVRASNYVLNWPVRAEQPFSVREHSRLCEALFVCPFHSPVNKLFLRKLITNNQLKFAPVYHEDIVFTNLVFLHARSLVWLDNGLYYYRKRRKDAEYLSLTQSNYLLDSLDSLQMIYYEMQKLGVLDKAISGFVRFLYKGTVPPILEYPDLAPYWYYKVRNFWLEVVKNKYSNKFLSPTYRRHLVWLLRSEKLEDYLQLADKDQSWFLKILRSAEEAFWIVKTRVDIRYGYHNPLYRYSFGIFDLLFVNNNVRNSPWYMRFCYGLYNPIRLILLMFKRYYSR